MSNQPQSDQSGKVIVFVTRGNNKSVRYVLTTEDYLTLARAIEFEGSPKEAVGWTLLQRFAFLYPTYKSLARFIRAYAQPINPLWFSDGPLHKDWLRKLLAAKRIEDAESEVQKAKRRAIKAATPLEKISASTLATIEHLFSAGTSPVPGSIHYRAPTIRTDDTGRAVEARETFAKERHLAHVYDVGNPTRDNWFFGMSSSRAFRIQLARTGAKIGHAIFLLGASGALAHLVWRVSKSYGLV